MRSKTSGLDLRGSDGILAQEKRAGKEPPSPALCGRGRVNYRPAARTNGQSIMRARCEWRESLCKFRKAVEKEGTKRDRLAKAGNYFPDRKRRPMLPASALHEAGSAVLPRSSFGPSLCGISAQWELCPAKISFSGLAWDAHLRWPLSLKRLARPSRTGVYQNQRGPSRHRLRRPQKYDSSRHAPAFAARIWTD